jgi:hypothetical protein
VFDLYSQIGITEVCFDVKKSGIHIYTTYDKSVHTMATFSACSFCEYDCEKESISTLNIKAMKENLKNVTSVDTIELCIRKDRELCIKVSKKTIEFEKKVQLKETQFYDLPTILDQAKPLNIKSGDFLEFCRSISGKYIMTIKSENGKGQISFESDKSKTIIKSDGENNDDILTFEGEFKAEYFSKLKKLTKFNSNLKIYPSPFLPLMFETTMGNKEKDKITIWIKSLKQMEEDYDEQDN